MKKDLGFTLIELLVVISIIGLLASVVLVSLSSARVKSRDVRRKSDLKQMRAALELYYNDNSRYPIVVRWATSDVTLYDNGTKWASLQTQLASYMPKLPKDPLSTPVGASASGPWAASTYHYAYGSDTGAIYDLVAQLENTSDSDRCQVKLTQYHHGEGSTPVDGSWCGLYSSQMYADH